MSATAEPFRAQAQHNGGKLMCLGSVGQAGAVTAWVNRQLLEKTINVLLANALEAMLRGGELRSELRRDSAGAVITVTNTDAGITDQDILYVFAPFFTTKADAVGITLSTVKRIASEHHWDLAVDNHQGLGATFILTVPLLPYELLAKESEEGVATSNPETC
ncbi:hypothetical protein DFAR_2910031 [Desulfarculales bacterium]